MDRRDGATGRGNRRSLIKLAQANAGCRRLWQVWSDFVELSALDISYVASEYECRCGLPRQAVQAQRQDRFRQIAQGYSREEMERFARMLACVVDELEEGPCDFLGSVFMELELSNHWRGQYFTPDALCALMARLQFSGCEAEAVVARNGFLRALEPACGAGAMVIALFAAMREAGFNPQRQLHVTAIDICSTAVHMTYVQLSLLGVPAIVIHGNALRPSENLDDRQHWHTPMHAMGLWAPRLQVLARREQAAEPAPEPRQTDALEAATTSPAIETAAGQLQLF